MLPFRDRADGTRAPRPVAPGQPALFRGLSGRTWFGRNPLRSLARRNAWSGYEGPVEGEPVVAVELQQLTAELLDIRRSNEDVVPVRQDLRRAQEVEQRQRERHRGLLGAIRNRVARSAGVPMGEDRAAQATYSDAEAGRHEQAAADRELAAAASSSAEANRRMEALSEVLMDVLFRHAAAGVALINRYIAELNDVRTGEGKEAFRPLNVEETARGLAELVLLPAGGAT